MYIHYLRLVFSWIIRYRPLARILTESSKRLLGKVVTISGQAGPPFLSCRGAALEHQMTHRQQNPALASRWVLLVIFAQAPRIGPPAERALHNPTPRLNDEAMHGHQMRYDLHHPTTAPQRPLHQWAAIGAVRPQVGQPRVVRFGPPEQLLRPGGVTHIGRRHHAGQQPALRIDQQMALAPGHFFAAIITAPARLLGGLHTLAVHNPGAGLRVPPGRRADLLPQGGVDPFQGAMNGPLIKVVADHRPGWEVVGQGAPLAPSTVYIEQGIDDLAQVVRTRMASGAGWRKQGREQVPLGRGQVARIRWAGIHNDILVQKPYQPRRGARNIVITFPNSL